MSNPTTRTQLSRALVALAALFFLYSLVQWLRQEPVEGTTGAMLNPEELDSLRPFLTPAREVPPWLEEPSGPVTLARGGVGGPDPWVAPPEPPEPAVSELARQWSVTAILLRPGRRVAVLNDRQVKPGDVLNGGVRVAAIEADRVVLQGPDGERQVVWLNERGEN